MRYIAQLVILITLLLSCSSSSDPVKESGAVSFKITGDSQLNFLSFDVKVSDKTLTQAFNITSSMKSGNYRHSFLLSVYDEIVVGEWFDLDGGNYVIITIDGNPIANYRSESLQIRFIQYDTEKIQVEFSAELFNIDEPGKLAKLESGKFEFTRK